MRYVRDIPADSPPAVHEAEEAHVRAHLAAAVEYDDNPDRRAVEVGVWTIEHPDDPRLLRIVGEVDGEPDAPYLRDGYDPLAGVDPLLYAVEVTLAQRDEEATDGPH